MRGPPGGALAREDRPEGRGARLGRQSALTAHTAPAKGRLQPVRRRLRASPLLGVPAPPGSRLAARALSERATRGRFSPSAERT